MNKMFIANSCTCTFNVLTFHHGAQGSKLHIHDKNKKKINKIVNDLVAKH